LGLSKLSEKCRKCKYVDTCNHKRMEALAYFSEAANTAGLNAAAPIIRPHDYRDIKINANTTVTIDLEDLKRDINKQLYGNLMQFGM